MPESNRSHDPADHCEIALSNVVAPAGHAPIPLLTEAAGNDASCAPSSYELYHAAQARRSAMQAELIRKGCRALLKIAGHAWKRYRQRRKTRAICDALYVLDDRTLRDLGFHRSEISSLAAEATGEAERTRVRPRAPGW